MNKQVIKKVSFSETQVGIIEDRRAELGLSFSEYIKHLITLDASKKNQSYKLSDDEINKLGYALRDVALGNTYTAKTPDDLQDVLDSWKK